MSELVDPTTNDPKDLPQLEGKAIGEIKPISENDVMWQWALGEAQNPKWARRNVQIDLSLQEKIRKASPQDLDRQFSQDERKKILDAFFSDKDRLAVQNILAMNCQWSKGTISIDGIKDLYMVQWPLSEQLAPFGKLLEYTKAFQAGKFPQEAKTDMENIERMRKTFEKSQMIGAPIVLSQTGKPPYCAIDGITRLSVVIMNAENGQMQEGQFPIIVGVSEKIFDWNKMPRQMMRQNAIVQTK